MTAMDPNTEIRKLRPTELYTLARILSISDSWKELMAVVPKEGTENVPKFSSEHFIFIENASSQQRKSAAEIFLEEWSTMGKKRPTLRSIIELLVKAELFRAADYIAVDLLKGSPPERPKCGPAAPIDISEEELRKLMDQNNPELGFPLDSMASMDNVLDEMAYPSHLSNESLINQPIMLQQVQQQLLETNLQNLQLGYSQETYNQRLQLEQIHQNPSNSNLIQFSKSVSKDCANDKPSNCQRSNSNLMIFSSGSIQGTTNADQVIPSIPNFSQINVVHNTHNNVLLDKKNPSTTNSSPNYEDEYSSNVEYNINVTSNENNCNELELQTSELPAFVADIGRGSTSFDSELKSSELPQFVVEIAHQRSGLSAGSERLTEQISSNDFTSSGTSSNYSINTTELINTESNIPVCVNALAQSFDNNELVSAELPQFVADLGHSTNHVTTLNVQLSNAKSNRYPEEYSSSVAGVVTTTADEYSQLNSQELPLVVSECNKMHSQLEKSQRELVSAELPQCITEL